MPFIFAIFLVLFFCSLPTFASESPSENASVPTDVDRVYEVIREASPYGICFDDILYKLGVSDKVWGGIVLNYIIKHLLKEKKIAHNSRNGKLYVLDVPR